MAIIPEIALKGSRQQSSVQRRDIMTATLTLHLFMGESCEPLDSFVAEVDMTTRNHGIFRSINVLNDPSRAELLAALKAPISGLVRRMANSMQCAPLTARLSLAGATLTVPVGSHHGMRQNALAVATGTDTPWQIMRVTSVDEMQSTLTPLNEIEISLGLQAARWNSWRYRNEESDDQSCHCDNGGSPSDGCCSVSANRGS